MIKYDVIIIGGGPAGISATRVFGQANSGLRVALIRPEPHSIIYCAMPYVIEGEILLEKTFKADALVTDNGVDLIRDKAIAVDFKTREITCASGNKYSYQKLLIATGAQPILPDIKGRELRGVITFKTEGDLSALMEDVASGLKKVVVVGAGAIGIELAQALKAQGVEVHLVDMQDHILPALVDPEMVVEAQKMLQDKGIILYLNNRVVSLEGEEGVDEVILANGKGISFGGEEGLVVFCVGMRADIDFLRGTELTLGRNGIPVNAGMETNLPGVYAAGDCVEYQCALTGRVIEGKLATNAVPMGKVAGRRILGDDIEYAGFYNGAATKIYTLRIGGTGFTERAAKENGYTPVTGYGETTTKFPIIPGAKKVKIKLIADKGSRRIIGGQVVGGEAVVERVDIITFAMQKKARVDELAALSYAAQPYQSFYPANNAIVMAAEEIAGKLKK
ncbi:NAD(P)/FAD-dependent oxidoreductase [Moorella sp. Hama-1]|uniref:NAD(P)/FAD-dependent oxidoreductase n=1 Tax=Moorella sp. Hama-1 TaxID=2138101 RepID=UPI000D640ECD|nr:FAD-dependent oxidoreductase [Moorella sp. Hama-1]